MPSRAKSRARIMAEMTVKEMRDGLKKCQTVILPIGCVEQHGYHLPLGTDIHNAVEISRRVSARTGCLVAPAVHYSFSGGMLPGTINVSPATVTSLLGDIATSLHVQGFRTIGFLLGHGGSELVDEDHVEVFGMVGLEDEATGTEYGAYATFDCFYFDKVDGKYVGSLAGQFIEGEDEGPLSFTGCFKDISCEEY